MILQFALLLSAFTSVPLTGSLWGGDGHRLVCEVAWRHLTPQARRLVNGLRAGESGTFAESCTWADEVRDARPATYNYHFINIPAGVRGMSMQRDCGDPAKRCAPWAVRHYALILADSTMGKGPRLEALKFLSHIVGDLHQPLHAGRPSDRGGNRVMVAFFGDGEPTNARCNYIACGTTPYCGAQACAGRIVWPGWWPGFRRRCGGLEQLGRDGLDQRIIPDR